MSTHLETSRLWNIDECHPGRTSQWSSSLYPPPEVATFSYVLVKCISRKPSAFPKLRSIHDAVEGLLASALVVEWSSPVAFLLTTAYPMNIFFLDCFLCRWTTLGFAYLRRLHVYTAVSCPYALPWAVPRSSHPFSGKDNGGHIQGQRNDGEQLVIQ